MEVEMKIIGYTFLAWYCVASVFWMVRHPNANEFTIITNLPTVLTFGVNEDLRK